MCKKQKDIKTAKNSCQNCSSRDGFDLHRPEFGPRDQKQCLEKDKGPSSTLGGFVTCRTLTFELGHHLQRTPHTEAHLVQDIGQGKENAETQAKEPALHQAQENSAEPGE